MLFALLERFASCGWAGVGQGLRVRRRDLWISGDFCSFSAIFGQNLTDFIYFDKEKRSNSLRNYLPQSFGHQRTGKMLWGAGKQI